MKDPEAKLRCWFEQAKYDLKTFRWNAKVGLFVPVCFWAQQSAEKAVKVFLAESLLTLIRRKIRSRLLKWLRRYWISFQIDLYEK